MQGSDEADPVTFNAALQLLIKAGERIQHARDEHALANTNLLPGETEQ